MTVESRCKEAAQELASLDFVRIHSDDDADGIAAAGVLTRALDRAGVGFHLTCDRLDVSDYEKLEAHDKLLLLDQGAGELDRLARHPGDVIVVDHHVVQGRAPRALHVNPMLEGESGTSHCCTATLALLIALHMDPANQDLAPIAWGGIIGDRQHVPKLQGTNAHLLSRVTKGGALEARRGLPFEATVPLDQALAQSIDPYLPGIAGNVRKARGFLEELGLPPSATPEALEGDEEKRLASAIVARLLAHGVEGQVAEEVAGMRFTGPVAGRNVGAVRLAAILNACGRADRPGLGIAIAHGDAEALEAAEGLVDKYDEHLLRGLLQLERNPPTQLDHIQWFEAPRPELAGAHAGLGMTFIFPKDKPTFALKESGDRTKVSGRATHTLVARGVDLAEALRTAAGEAGGAGGGHPIASGAAVPTKNRDKFLARLDELIGGQLHAEPATV